MQTKTITVKPTRMLAEDIARLADLLGTTNTSEIVRQAVHKLRLEEDGRDFANRRTSNGHAR